MHLHLNAPVLASCPKCGKKVRQHTVCNYCGYYKGKEIINVLERLAKKEKKKRQKEIAGQEGEEKKAKPLSAEELSKK